MRGTVVSLNLLSGDTDTKHYQRLTHNVYRFIPVRMKAEDLARFHCTNERVGVESYGEAIQFYIQLLHNAAG